MTAQKLNERVHAVGPRLNEGTLSKLSREASRFAYDRDKINAGIVHFGPGAFHRAHQAVYTDTLLNSMGGDLGICAVSVNNSTVRDILSAQDNLYTFCILGEQVECRIIGSILKTIVASEDPALVIQTLVQREIRAVTLTITEKGYCLAPDGTLDFAHPKIAEDIKNPSHPKSAIGLLAAGLSARKKSGLQAIPIISCDNLTSNGLQLRQALLDFSAATDPDLSKWIEDCMRFPCTMVDSITPATDQAIIDLVGSHTNLVDFAPVQREPFTQWIIEDIDDCALPPWHLAGADIRKDVSGYELAKHRIVNGLHTSATFLGLLRGLHTVADVMRDADIRRFLQALADEEIIPSLPQVEGLNPQMYVRETFNRFSNTRIHHELRQIAWDTTKKLPYRLLATLEENLAAGRPHARICKVLAAWMRFIVLRSIASEPIVDPLANRLRDFGRWHGTPTFDLVCGFLSLQEVFPAKLALNPSVRLSVAKAYDSL